MTEGYASMRKSALQQQAEARDLAWKGKLKDQLVRMLEEADAADPGPPPTPPLYRTWGKQ